MMILLRVKSTNVTFFSHYELTSCLCLEDCRTFISVRARYTQEYKISRPVLAYHYDSLTPYRSKHFLKLDSNFESDFRIQIVPELAYEEYFLTSHTNLKHYFCFIFRK